MILAPQAVEDLTGIFVYIAGHAGVQTATDFVADIEQKIRWIADSGFSGAPRDWIRPGLRALPCRGRCIYFRADEEVVHVLRVVHGAQDIEELEFPNSDKPDVY